MVGRWGMKEIELLELEIKLLLDNIKRLKAFAKNSQHQYQSSVVGEFKHRLIALKQRLTLASKIVTSDLHQ